MRVLACLLLASLHGAAATRHIVFVMTDGLRWQEVFAGSDPSLLEKGQSATGRETLMPFLWGVVAKQGQIFGNRKAGSAAYVTNRFYFSYP